MSVRSFIASVTVWSAFICAPAAASEPTPVEYRGLVAHLIEGYVRPASANFADQAATLPSAINAVCAAPNDQTRAAFASAYGNVVDAFGGISFLRFGPLAEENRLSRLAFLPDPRGITERQLRKILASEDDKVTSAKTLSGKSVAVQGLGALELIAFDKVGNVTLGGDEAQPSFTCNYARAIGENVLQIAQDTKAAWYDPQGFSKTLLSPDANDSHIRNPKEALETMFNALTTGVVVIKDQDILPALGEHPESSKPHRIPFSRSKNGLGYLIAQVRGIRNAIASAGFDAYLIGADVYIVRGLDFELRNVIRLLVDIPVPVRESLTTPEAFGKMNAAVYGLSGAKSALSNQLSPALALSGGFNALDGD
ncbi:hypothetical protein JM93_03892 [Roseibium hamelinense]|uniref:Imelysin-like domain-containing protein n=1 Tax=Roseibium hamelinense TaxID=150831 RepID=A0A562SKU0_9HYPH|nr:imelysin family protein [Roseibium hamelinense]MTI43468.1 hypothetical protein [Roseibium hamelinense]TWI81929.1 hypothetical protein JM93_03892 [Roseibium hamelinense]